MALIIVESPTKAKTFNRILEGGQYYVFATMGHVRDLPSNKLGLDYKNEFQPTYGIIKKKENVVAELMELAKKNKEIILATDPDREGESISYHIAYLLGYIEEKWPDFSLKKSNLKRIVFHEITASALKEALEKPESLRLNLVKAQQARRLLDRIVGYELSPLLWKKLGKNWLSAGRVQTVALRLIVEREKEIKKFEKEDYFQINGDFQNHSLIKAKLTSKDGVSYEQKFTLKLFAGTYQYTKTTIDSTSLDPLKKDLEQDTYTISNIKETISNRYPPPPFTTSLLQQDAFGRFGFSSKMTMRIAQDLYEQGLITYHRTDSFNLSPQFVTQAKKYIDKSFGKEYGLEQPRGYKTKSKLAQEAHEAIRPTLVVQDPFEGKDENDKKLTQNHRKLYKLIFDRAVATQMKEASVKSIKVQILGQKNYLFEADMQKVLFDGFLRVLNPTFSAQNQGSISYKVGDLVKLQTLEVLASQTKPPPRYNEASLIKILEEKGIGRPSTYAPIISLIVDKNYVEKEEKSLLPTILGIAISDYLASAFPSLFELNFTASMEEGLDKIAAGEENILHLLTQFNTPFQKQLKEKKDEKKVIDVEEKFDEKCPRCGSQLMIRYSRFGKFIACSGYPKCKFTKPFLQYIPNKLCPKDKGRIVVRFTKTRKKFFGCENYPQCDFRSWKLNF